MRIYRVVHLTKCGNCSRYTVVVILHERITRVFNVVLLFVYSEHCNIDCYFTDMSPMNYTNCSADNKVCTI